jgi:SAM-dependent methyltransferase
MACGGGRRKGGDAAPGEAAPRTPSWGVPPAFPLTLGDRDDFARVADYLHAAAYDAQTVCRRLAVPELFAVDDLPPEAVTLPPAAHDPLAFLVRTFLLLEPTTERVLRARLDAATRAAFERLGLLAREPDGDTWTAPVLLYPVREFHVASDRHRNPDRSPFTPPPDAVFPAIFPGTMRFLRLLPQGTYDDALDLGAGTGIGALVLSRRVRRAVAADLTERATHFARFNRLLNACDNVDAIAGDLYAPVAGRAFDCIVAHPPYVPSPDDAFVFRDGGPTGERFVRRMIAELPSVLRPGGVFCAVCAAWDTANEPLEARVRGWLGARADEFDLLLGVETELEPGPLAERLATPGSGGDGGSVAAWEARFREAGLACYVYGVLALARRDGAGTPATLRTWLSPATQGADLERTLATLGQRAAHLAAGTRARSLDALRPRLANGLTVHVTYAPRDGALAPAEVILETQEPFRSRTRIDPWMLALLTAFDGAHTPGQVHQALRASGALPDGFARDDLRRFLELLLERGYVGA